MQRARRTPVAGRGLLALATTALLALGLLVVPAGPAHAARSQRPAGASALALSSPSVASSALSARMGSAAARSSARAGDSDSLKPAGPAPLHLAATPSSAVGLDVRAPRAAPAEHDGSVLTARPMLASSSRAPPTGR